MEARLLAPTYHMTVPIMMLVKMDCNCCLINYFFDTNKRPRGCFIMANYRRWCSEWEPPKELMYSAKRAGILCILRLIEDFFKIDQDSLKLR